MNACKPSIAEYLHSESCKLFKSMHFLDWPDPLSITTCSLKLYSNAADKTRISVSLEGHLITTLFSVSWCKISTACAIVLVCVSSWVLSNRSYVFYSMWVSSLHSPFLYNTNSSHLNISKTYSLSFFITSINSSINQQLNQYDWNPLECQTKIALPVGCK